MRPVARIAQSVEQGIENPCVLGSIPSPGTIFKETSLGLVFCFPWYGLYIELRSIIRLILRLTPSGPAQALFKGAPRLCPSPGTLFKETSLRAGFLLSVVRTLHRTPFDYSSHTETHPFGASASAVQRCSAPLSESGTLFKETSLRAGFLLSVVRTLHRTPFDYSSHTETHPCGASASAVQRCSAPLSESGTLFKETSLRAGFLLSVVRTLHRTPFDYSSHTETHPCGASASAVQRCSAPLSESGTLFKETSLRAGFLLSVVRTLHRTPFDYSSHTETHPCGASASAVQRCSAPLSESGTLFKETSLRAGFLLSVVRTLHRTPFDYSSHTETHPCGASASAVQRCSAPLSESGTLFKETSLRAGFLLSVVRTLHRTPFDYSSHTETHPFGASASAVQRCSAPLSESGTLFKETSLRAGL